MISRIEFLQRFKNAFGDFSLGDALGCMTALMCIRTISSDGYWYYGAPFLVRDPLHFYYQMQNLDKDIFDRMYDCKAELCHIGEWSDTHGLCPFDIDAIVFVSFSDLFDKKEDTE